MSGNSFQRFDTIPSAILFDGVVPLPIYAVTQMSLNETYHLPPLGTNGAQTIVSTHDYTVLLQALVGKTRFGEGVARDAGRNEQARHEAVRRRPNTSGRRPPAMMIGRTCRSQS